MGTFIQTHHCQTSFAAENATKIVLRPGYAPGLILSVESNQNVESKMKNVESKA